MSGVMHSLGTAIGRMFRALIVWGVVIAGGATGWVFFFSHRLPITAEWVLIGGLAFVGGLLGAMAVLVWELSHLGQISRMVRSRQTGHPVH